MRFVTQLQKPIANNIANITTPNYIQQDVSVPAFQNTLREAIDGRNAAGGLGEFKLAGNEEIEPSGASAAFNLAPKNTLGGILFHDRNNRSLEMLEQTQVENGTMLSVCADLLKSRSDLMRAPTSERI